MARLPTDEERREWEATTRHDTPVRTRKKTLPPTPAKPRSTQPLAATVTAAAPLPIQPTRSKEVAPLTITGAPRGKAKQPRIEARLDLHGMTQAEAHAALVRFVVRAHAAGKRQVAIITGKGSRGEGVLRRAVPHWLEEPGLRQHISKVSYAPTDKGGDGVLLLWLKKA